MKAENSRVGIGFAGACDQLLCALTLLSALFAVPSAAYANAVPTGTVSITSGTAFSTPAVSDGFFISGNGLNLGSATPDGGEGVRFNIVQAGNQFLLTLTIFADAGTTSLGAGSCGQQSGGTFNGSVPANCLQGAITFTSILAGAPCLSQGNCQSNIPLQSGPFIASGEITGWTTPCYNCLATTEIFDVRVFGQGSADISTNSIDGITANYTFTTPEPTSFLLLGIGVTAVGLLKRRPRCHT
jgi:PEP-CTERM motif